MVGCWRVAGRKMRDGGILESGWRDGEMEEFRMVARESEGEGCRKVA